MLSFVQYSATFEPLIQYLQYKVAVASYFSVAEAE